MLTKICQEIFKNLNEISRAPQDSPGPGTTRLSYSNEHKKALNYLKSLSDNLKLTHKVDPFGNLTITYPGTQVDKKSILTGSHIDSVPNGGAFDGALGIIAPLAIFSYWKSIGFIPKHNIDLIAFAEEEGTRFRQVCLGSRYLCNELATKSPIDFIDTDGSGATLVTHFQNFGLPTKSLKSHLNITDKYEKFIELHIEQGPILENKSLSIGLVRSIVGILRYKITINGTANHAGTTPMNLRNDTLYTASRIITKLYDDATLSNSEYVATVGSIQNSPNAENVIPGMTTFIVEFRSENNTLLTQTLPTYIQELTSKIIDTNRFTYETNQISYLPPVPLNQELVNNLDFIATKLQIPHIQMPSGAGHDSMVIAKYLPTAMIFVPSKKGISHNPSENTDWTDIEKGLLILEKILKE